MLVISVPVFDNIVRNSFMDGCTKGNLINISKCACAFETMKDKLGTVGIVEVAIDYNDTGVASKVMINTYETCK